MSTDGMAATISSASSTSSEVGAPKRRAVAEGPHGRGEHLGDHVAEGQRPPGPDEVEVAVAVGVDQRGPLAAGDEAGRAADAGEGADGRVDATGDDPLGACEQGVGGGGLHVREGTRCAGRVHTAPYPRRVVSTRRAWSVAGLSSTAALAAAAGGASWYYASRLTEPPADLAVAEPDPLDLVDVVELRGDRVVLEGPDAARPGCWGLDQLAHPDGGYVQAGDVLEVDGDRAVREARVLVEGLSPGRARLDRYAWPPRGEPARPAGPGGRVRLRRRPRPGLVRPRQQRHLGDLRARTCRRPPRGVPLRTPGRPAATTPC